MNRLSARVFLSLWLVVFLGAGLFAIPSFAQQGTTAVVGEVTDPQGAAVNGAKVMIADPASGVSRETQTDEQGRFQFPSLQPGTYNLRVEAPGFRTALSEKIEALVSTTQRVNIQLELGTVSDTVTVSEGAIAPVNTTDATLGNAFDSRQILALPFEGRDAAGVLSLQPGVTYVGTNVDDNVDTRNGATLRSMAWTIIRNPPARLLPARCARRWIPLRNFASPPLETMPIRGVPPADK